MAAFVRAVLWYAVALALVAMGGVLAALLLLLLLPPSTLLLHVFACCRVVWRLEAAGGSSITGTNAAMNKVETKIN